MSIGRLYRGVVRVVTEEGPYYLRPQMRQRLRLLWMFRHFSELPAVVLKPGELRDHQPACPELLLTRDAVERRTDWHTRLPGVNQDEEAAAS